MWASSKLRAGLVGKNTWARVEALQRNQAFIGRCRKARADHLAGRGAIFPAGNWWLHRFAGVKCAELGATAPPDLPTAPWATLRVVHMPTATTTTSSCGLGSGSRTAGG